MGSPDAEAPAHTSGRELLNQAHERYRQVETDADDAVSKAESFSSRFKTLARNETQVKQLAADIVAEAQLKSSGLSLDKQAEALTREYRAGRSAMKQQARHLEREGKLAARKVRVAGREVEHVARKADQRESEYEKEMDAAERAAETLELRAERAADSAEDHVERAYDHAEGIVESKARELRERAKAQREAS